MNASIVICLLPRCNSNSESLSSARSKRFATGSARHEGKLPRKLDEVDLPVPRDPVVDALFKYVAAEDGRSATLSGALIEASRFGASTGKPPSKTGYRYELKRAD